MNLNWTRQREQKPFVGETREGFTFTYIPFLKSMLLFGGTHAKSNEIYLYSIKEKRWKTHKTNNLYRPTPRKFHTAFYSDEIKGLIICGGEAQKSRSLNDIQILLMVEKQWEWKKLLIESNFTARQHHTFTPINGGKDFFIFGGISLPYASFLNDSWILKAVGSLQKRQTYSIIGIECQQLKTKGSIPPIRCRHKTYSFGENVYVFGGEPEVFEQRFTLFILNLGTNVWSKHIFNVNLLQLMNFSIIPNPENPGQIIIMGGTFVKKNKKNRAAYSVILSSRNIKKISDVKSDIDQEIVDNCFPTPLGGIGCEWIENRNQSKLNMYNLNFKEEQESLGIQSYLKCIKSQQILSQELVKKVNNLETLYMEIQRYISALYKQYSEQYEEDIEVQEEKQKQIQHCLQLKEDYGKIQQLYQQNLQEIKLARRDIISINEEFEECIETEFDEEG